jgi:hypothetical protein
VVRAGGESHHHQPRRRGDWRGVETKPRAGPRVRYGRSSYGPGPAVLQLALGRRPAQDTPGRCPFGELDAQRRPTRSVGWQATGRAEDGDGGGVQSVGTFGAIRGPTRRPAERAPVSETRGGSFRPFVVLGILESSRPYAGCSYSGDLHRYLRLARCQRNHLLAPAGPPNPERRRLAGTPQDLHGAVLRPVPRPCLHLPDWAGPLTVAQSNLRADGARVPRRPDQPHAQARRGPTLRNRCVAAPFWLTARSSRPSPSKSA